LAIPIILDGVILSFLGIVITYCLNIYATPIAVFAYIIMLNIQTTVFTPVQGISKGLCIVTGHLAGAKRFIDLRKTIRKIFALGLILAGLIALLLVIFHNPIIALFSSEYIVVSEVRNMLMFVVICIITFPIIMGCSFVFLGLEKSLYTLIFIIFNLITLMTFIAVFTHVLGMSSFGIFSAIALSNLIEAIAMLLVLRKMLNTRISTYESVSGAQMA
jgi:Na+-driven multidrug efflux pump